MDVIYENCLNRNGGIAILIGNYLFNFHSYNEKDESEHWRCANRPCKVSATTRDGLAKLNGKDHMDDSLTDNIYSTDLSLCFHQISLCVAQQNISSYDKDENVKEESSDQETDEEPDSDNRNKGNMEYNLIASSSGEPFQLLELFVVSEDRIRCECNTKC
ncbi:unnamed protein product [Brachionus calyciflorus]|uniref:FLYWCH-type domain-containing protein n=1 Tax=Brachionus calyciflorus TaxID=104777 RepID=A0A813LXZ2_9BILA|nr:unnamed protein product [Brachionus calyciflorus]